MNRYKKGERIVRSPLLLLAYMFLFILIMEKDYTRIDSLMLK